MIQLISIKHILSGIRQTIFFTASKTGREEIRFQATGFGRTTNSNMDRTRLMETLRTWRDLCDEGVLTVINEDSLTMRRLAGCDFLEQVTGAAPERTADD